MSVLESIFYIFHRVVGPLLTLSPELCFVVEDEEGVMGYVVAAADAKQLRQKMNVAWFPSMCEKYSKPENVAELTPAEVDFFYGPEKHDCCQEH